MAKKEQPKEQEAKTIKQLQDQIEKQFGTGAVMCGQDCIVPVDALSTGVAAIDLALGCGGIPLGRIVELYGAESSGKTTTCLQIIANCQRSIVKGKDRQGRAAFIDAEHALDPVWASKVGVNMNELLISQPDSGEEALKIAECMAESGLIDVIVIDSVAALIPKKMLDGELDDASMAAQAQMMSKAMGRLKGKCNKSKTAIIFINQIRMKVGVVFGNPESTPGGRALKFYASVRVDVRRKDAIKAGEKQIGMESRIKIVKNKVAPPFREAEYAIYFGEPELPICGVDTVGSLLSVAAARKIVTLRGSSYSLDGTTLGNGITRAAATVRANPELLDKIKEKTYNELFGQLRTVPSLPESELPEEFEFDDESEGNDE